jgi:parallel beta-helix repeat protein
MRDIHPPPRLEATAATRSRRFVVLTAALLTVAGVLAVPSPAGGVAGFGDVDAGQFYTAPVQWMVDNEITTGTSPTCFSPADEVTRGQAAAFMWRMEGSPVGSPAHPFTDVIAAWQQDPISWMAATGITTGTSPSTYTPEGPVTRGEIAALLHRLAGSPDAPPSQFGDVTTSWQVTPVGWMVQQQITTGTTASTFSPDKTVTRGEIATFFYRYQGSPAVTVDPTHPALPPCDDQVPGPATTGTLFLTESTTLIQNHNGNIVIAADNITLDCAGHTLTGPGRTSGVAGVDINQRTGVTVRRCNLQNFNDAFRVHDSSGNSFVDNTMSTLRQGFILIRSDNNTLSGNMVSDANDFFGIQLDRSNGNTLTGNTVVDSEHGFLLWDSDNNTLTGNTSSRNTTGLEGRIGGNGFGVGVNSDSNVLSGNTSTDNIVGFHISDDAVGNTLSSNQALRNSKWGILDTTTGTGDLGTGNAYQGNSCSGSGWGPSEPGGLC